VLVLGRHREVGEDQHEDEDIVDAEALLDQVAGEELQRDLAAGAALIKEFHWIIYLFGAFLIITGIRMALHRNEEIHPDRNPLVKLVRRILPVTGEYHGQKFFVRQAGVLLATPLFLALVMVEFTDLIFAVDSIPAIFAVTTDPFIVYTSNVFAILGLRSLYFVLRGVVDKFSYLKLSLAAVLTFVGVKMVLTDLYKVPVGLSLAVIATLLAAGIAASVWRNRRAAAGGAAGDAQRAAG
jgi:tellurite resistance protein TerC